MTEDTEKPGRGGYRPNSGRPKGRKRITITVSLPVEQVERLKTEAEQRGIERSAIVGEALAGFWREQREPS